MIRVKPGLGSETGQLRIALYDLALKQTNLKDIISITYSNNFCAFIYILESILDLGEGGFYFQWGTLPYSEDLKSCLFSHKLRQTWATPRKKMKIYGDMIISSINKIEPLFAEDNFVKRNVLLTLMYLSKNGICDGQKLFLKNSYHILDIESAHKSLRDVGFDIQDLDYFI